MYRLAFRECFGCHVLRGGGSLPPERFPGYSEGLPGFLQRRPVLLGRCLPRCHLPCNICQASGAPAMPCCAGPRTGLSHLSCSPMQHSLSLQSRGSRSMPCRQHRGQWDFHTCNAHSKGLTGKRSLPGVDTLMAALLACRMTLATTWAAMWKMSLVLSACALNARTAAALPMLGGTISIAGDRLARPGALCASLAVLKSSKDIRCLQIMPCMSAEMRPYPQNLRDILSKCSIDRCSGTGTVRPDVKDLQAPTRAVPSSLPQE